MGCGKGYDTGSCVADILREIVDAQKDIQEFCCDTGCEQSISDLLGESDNRKGLDTVPVILYCKDCKPFKGFGADKKHGKIGKILSSFIFRVKSIDKDNCAVLELLLSDGETCGYNDMKDPTDQNTKDLEATGICITVDVDCFCHITCLPAIDALN
jgi:spore coat protein Z